MFTPLQQREVFHLLFLKQLAGRLKPDLYAVKGGVNLRLFFGSIRYSEDMDIDVKGIESFRLKDIVMEILLSKTLITNLRTFNIERVVPPAIIKAKQTETTQRFKIHLINTASEDLFTKIEFSRRKLEQPVIAEMVSETILKPYKLPSLFVSHYPADIAVSQKIRALADRAEPQARDIFDLYLLLPRMEKSQPAFKSLSAVTIKKAYGHVFDIDFSVFKDTVISYLDETDQHLYNRRDVWEDMQLKVGHIIESLAKHV